VFEKVHEGTPYMTTGSERLVLWVSLQVGYDTSGFLASKTDWQGNTTTYIRNAKGQELSRTEAAGTPDERTIITQWHATFNLPTKVTEPGRETTYDYDANGNLLSQSVVDLVQQ